MYNVHDVRYLLFGAKYWQLQPVHWVRAKRVTPSEVIMCNEASPPPPLARVYGPTDYRYASHDYTLSAWWVKTGRAPCRHGRDARVYGPTDERPCMIRWLPSPRPRLAS